MVGCGWVGGGGGVVWGGRMETSLVEESTRGESEHELVANQFPECIYITQFYIVFRQHSILD